MSEIVEINGHKVSIKKRKGQKHLRLRITNDGTALLTMPKRYPKFLALEFLKSKNSWIEKHAFIGQAIGQDDLLHSGHRVNITSDNQSKNSFKVSEYQIEFKLADYSKSTKSQKYMESKIIGVYEDILIPIIEERLEYFSQLANLDYKSFEIKRLKSKWGSCDRHKHLKFSTYLIAQDRYLIDYVVMHELAHTKYMDHSEKFWKLCKEYMPDFKERKNRLKNSRMLLLAKSTTNM